MGLIVQKYGGSSLANAEKIKNVAKRIIKTKNKGNKVIVTVSAMGDTTDDLLALSESINPSPARREMDMLLSTGEQVSIALTAMAIDSFGEKVLSLTGPQAGIYTDGIYSRARIKNIKTDRLKKELENTDIIIVAGFQGISETSDITTLGRGGSDTTAVALAAALDADVCEIYTDVDGVYAADPRLVPNAKKIESICYDDMLQLAVFGSKVLNPRSVELAKQYNIVIHLRSSLNDHIGTFIKGASMLEKDMIVSGIAHDYNIVKMAIFAVPNTPGIAASIFKSLGEKNINVRIIVQSAAEVENMNNISFIIDKDDKDEAVSILEKNLLDLDGKKIIVEEDVAIVSIVGSGLITNAGGASQMFEVLSENGINIDMISTSEATICTVIPSKYCEIAVKELTKHFNLCD